MEQPLHTPEVYDYRQYDRIWQRVAPALEPYPPAAQPPSQPPAAPVSLAPRPAQEGQLPGAQRDPCCLGTAAGELLEVLTGFIDEETETARVYQYMRAPAWARQTLWDIGADHGRHARRLMAIYYLITGTCAPSARRCERLSDLPWCAALRERYHAAVCTAMNYARTADSTTDHCLAALLNELSADEYRHADCLLEMLQRSLRATK